MLSLPEFDIVQHLRQQGPTTRNDLGEILKVSRSKITTTAQNLIDCGILEETTTGESTGGRRPGMLDFNPAYGYVLAIHMGATGATIAIADFRGQTIETIRYIITREEYQNPQKVMDKFFEHVSRMLKAHQILDEKVLAISIGLPAPIDKETNTIVSPATLYGWSDFSVHDYWHKHFPCAVVKLDNDVSLMALGELRAGKGQGHENFFVVKIGTGVGCGIVTNGEVFRGSTGLAGHIGHVSINRNGPVCHCGNIGCLERFTAGPAIAEQGMRAVDEGRSPIMAELLEARGTQLQAEDVGAAAARGDRAANAIIVESGRVIGEVLSTLVSFFNPSVVIIAGGVCNIGPQLLTSIHRTILEYSMPASAEQIQVLRSDLGYRAGLEGTIDLALNGVFIPEQ